MTPKELGNQPAYPEDYSFTNRCGESIQRICPGLTKREYMAVHICAGLVAYFMKHDNEAAQARDAVDIADALLAKE
jgi:hypothetical protein